ncbi:hypothetical protein BLOT_010768 [Blomia tropicalis]|nr:hypothetical protein BLOT_010768 [Blomia tropicalis]
MTIVMSFYHHWAISQKYSSLNIKRKSFIKFNVICPPPASPSKGGHRCPFQSEASHSSEATEMKCLFHDWFICDEDDDDDDDDDE